MLRNLLPRDFQLLVSNVVHKGPWHIGNLALSVRAMSGNTSSPEYDFKTLKVTVPAEFVKQVHLNRPDRRNAMNTDFWGEMVACFNRLALDKDCRVIILSGEGKVFTSGLDLTDNEVFTEVMSATGSDIARNHFMIKRFAELLQNSFNVIEKCPKPVIAAVHSACLGAGVDMLCSCDVRYATQDAWFQIKEVDLGLAADLGTLNRFPKIVGNDSTARELVYSTRKFFADEAQAIGFVSRTFQDKSEMMAAALELAQTIAKKSPVAVQGSKVNLIYARDHNVPQSLDYMATWNAAMLQSEDVVKAISGLMQKEEPVFSKL